MWKKGLLLLLAFCSVTFIHCQFECHDDPTYDPEEGTLLDLQFTWLGALQYIHVKKGSPHYFRVPRVLLISRQFALSTAVDAGQVPDGYALGNVVFGEYERDEVECQVSMEEIVAGAECEPAVLIMPIADVLLHPEYNQFGGKYSYAILKLLTPIKSRYMLPVCLPFKNHVTRKHGSQGGETLFHIDFSSEVPRDFVDEEKEVTRLNLLPKDACRFKDDNDNLTNINFKRVICSNGCGFHSGAPTVVHEHTGHWSVVAMAQGGSPCPDPLRPGRSLPPPRHVLLLPYVPWITAVIGGRPMGAFLKDDPFGFIVPRVSDTKELERGWVGHWWMGGIRCYDRGVTADDLFRFYHEIFQITPTVKTDMSYYIQIDAAHEAVIVCVKIGMPYSFGDPRIWDIETSSIKLRVPVKNIRKRYKIQVEAWARNHTEMDDVEPDVGEAAESGEESDESNGDSTDSSDDG